MQLSWSYAGSRPTHDILVCYFRATIKKDMLLLMRRLYTLTIRSKASLIELPQIDVMICLDYDIGIKRQGDFRGVAHKVMRHFVNKTTFVRHF